MKIAATFFCLIMTVSQAEPTIKDNLRNAVQSQYLKLKDNLRDMAKVESDVLRVEEVDVKFESCGASKDAMEVKAVHYDPMRSLVTAEGSLSKAVTEGQVTAKLGLAKDSHMGRFDRVKTRMALMVSGSRHREELCKHISRGKARYEMNIDEAPQSLDEGVPSHACPLSPGDNMLHFTVKHLPKTVMAGHYEMNVTAVDESGGPLLCLRGKIVVPQGPGGEVLRRLEGHEAGSVSGAETIGSNLHVGFAIVFFMMAWRS